MIKVEELCNKDIEKKVINLIGKRFGKLVVMGLDHKEQTLYKNGRKRIFYYWKCKCDCGKKVVRSGNSLRDGRTTSCGCNRILKRKLTIENKKMLKIKTNTNKIDLTGKVFGKLLVIGLDHKKQVLYTSGRKKTYYYWKCACECENEVVRFGESLRRGATISCGCQKFYKQMLNNERKKYLKGIKKENQEKVEEEFE